MGARGARVVFAVATGAMMAAVIADAAAFVPPASFVFRRMGAQLSRIRGVIATVAGRSFVEAGDAGAPTEGKLYLAAPDRFRLDLASPKGHSREIWIGRSKRTGAGGASRTETVARSHPLAALFLGGNPSGFTAERRIDTAVVTLARAGSRICWVIGAKETDASSPQLWVDKDTFLPARLVLTEGEGDAGRVVEWRFDGYDLVDALGAFPRTLELRVGGVRVLQVSLVSLDVRSVPNESAFTSPTTDK